jgi:hypothetical protein
MIFALLERLKAVAYRYRKSVAFRAGGTSVFNWRTRDEQHNAPNAPAVEDDDGTVEELPPIPPNENADPDGTPEDEIGTAPVNIVVPTISGTLTTGGTLVANAGTWTQNPTELTYQWYSSGVIIPGAIEANYEVTVDDIGDTITVIETATNAYGTASATSAATGTVTGIIPVNTAVPTISGTKTVAETLTCAPGTWTGVPSPSFTFQWKAATVAISGATAINYLLTAAEEGDTITCTVTGTNSAGSASATSAATTAIAANSAAAPVLSNLTASAVGDTSESVSVDTDKKNGSIYWVVVPSAATVPTEAQIKAGTDGDNNAAFWTLTSPVAAVDSYYRGVTGLTKGSSYKVYAVHQDNVANYSNIVNASFTAGGVAATPPGLSSFTATAGADDRWGELSIDTDQATGTIFWVVALSTATAPSATQLINGLDGSGTAAAFSGATSISTSGTKTKRATTLTHSTTYKAYAVHRNASNTVSSVATSSAFTTDVLIASRATAGTTTSLTAINGSIAGAIADADSGSNAVRYTDNNDSATGSAGIQTSNNVTFYNGVNKFAVKLRVQQVSAAAMWARLTPGNVSVTGNASFNISAGTVGTEAWAGTPTIDSLGGGWYQIRGSLNMAGADLTGLFTVGIGDADNDGTIVRNGQNKMDYYDLRITRAS